MDDANADSEAPEGDAAPARTPSHAPLQGLLLAVSAAAAAEPADAADGAHPERAVSGASKDGLGTRRSIRKRPTSVRSEGRTEPASAAADAWPVAALGEKWDVAQAPPRLNPCGDLARGKLPDVHPPRRGPSAAAAAQQNDTSAFIGVSWATRERQWVVQVHHGGRKHYVGLFDDEREAARAFDGAARRLRPRGLAHGGRAGYQWKRVNFPTAAEQAFAEGEGMPDKKCKAQAALTLACAAAGPVAGSPAAAGSVTAAKPAAKPFVVPARSAMVGARSVGVVWAKWMGSAKWPALWVSLADVQNDDVRQQLERTQPSQSAELVEFFGTYDYAWVGPDDLTQFAAGTASASLLQKKSGANAVRLAEEYLALLETDTAAAADDDDDDDATVPEGAAGRASKGGLGPRRSIHKQTTSARLPGKMVAINPAALAPAAALGRGGQPVAPQQQCVTSAFVGVSWHKQEDRWVAQVNHGGRKHYVGLFADEEEAARAFDGAARRLRPTGKAHGGRSGNQWVRVNFPEVAEQAFAEGEGMPDKKSKAPRR